MKNIFTNSVVDKLTEPGSINSNAHPVRRIYTLKKGFFNSYLSNIGCEKNIFFNIAFLLLGLFSLQGTLSAQNVSATWGLNSNSAWYTTGNWAGGAYAGVQGAAASNNYIATFTSAATATTFGINCGTASLNLGAISLDNTRITATNIGNSSATAGVLRLYGATVNSVNNVILRNNGTGLLTLQGTQTGTMGVVLGNATDNIVNIDNTGSVTISAVISELVASTPLTKGGTGTGVLQLTGANTYTGLTTVSGGTLQLNRTGGTTIPAGNSVVVNNGATLRISTAQTLNNVTVNAGGTLIVDATLTVTGTATINGTFQINQGGYATGTWTYGASGTLIYNLTSGTYGPIDASHTYWPSSNGPANVTVQCAGGAAINMGVARTVPSSGTTGTFLLVSGANSVQGTALTLNGTTQINGGNFQTTPTYGASSTLIYNLSYTTSNEWTAGGTTGVTAGSGIPANVTVQAGTLTLSGNRGVPGAVTVNGGATLNLSAGDLYLGGNLANGGTFTHNNKAVFFVGTAQTVSGTFNNTGGVSNGFAYILLYNGTNITLGAPAFVNNNINFNAGKITIGANDLTMAGGATFTTPGSASYIVTNSTGQLKQTVAGVAKLYPVGNSAYNPLTLTNSGTSDIYGIRVLDGAITGAFDITKTIDRRWNITEAVAGGSNLTIAATFNSGEENNAANFAAAFTPYVGLYNGAWTVATASLGGTTFTSTGGIAPADLTTAQSIGLGKDDGLAVPPSPPTINVTGGVVASAPGSGTSGYVGNTITINGTDLGAVTIVKVGGSGGTAVTITGQTATTLTFTAINLSGQIYVQNGVGNATSTETYTNLGYITTAGASNWNTAASWLGGAVPPANSLATVAHALNLAAAITFTPLTTVTVISGGTLTVSNAAGSLTTTNLITSGAGLISYTTAGSITATSITNNSTISFAAAGNLLVAAGGTFNNPGTFTAGTGTVTFNGSGTVSGTVVFNNAIVNGAVNFGTASTINGTLQINTGGSLTTNTVTYGSASTLLYNTTSNPYNIGNEWTGGGAVQPTVAGAGVPNNITIQNTNNVTTAAIRGLAGNLLITNGNLTLGNDLYVSGNWTRTGGAFTPGGRSVFFNGTSAQLIDRNESFAYLVIDNTNVSGVSVTSNAPLVSVTANTGDVLQLNNSGPLNINSTSVLSLTGNGGNITLGGGAGLRTVNFPGGGRLAIYGNKTVTSSGGATLSVTAISSGGVEVGTTGGPFFLDPGNNLTTIQSSTTLYINAGLGYVNTNTVNYAAGSRLAFLGTGTYNVGIGDKTWAIGASGSGVPFNVLVGSSGTPTVTISENRTATNSVSVSLGTFNNNTNTLTIASAVTLLNTAVNINGGTFNNNGGTLNLGPTGGGKQVFSLSSGTFSINAGAATINGNISLTGGNFSQTGGTITVDGNAAGVAANSVASGTSIVAINIAGGLTLSGGSLIIVDPHAGGGAADAVFTYSNGGNFNIPNTHTIQFGNGVSTDAGGNAVGYLFDTWAGTNRMSFGNVIVNAPAGTNRTVQPKISYGINGNLTVTAGELLVNNTTYVTGNIVNNGTLTSSATVQLATFLNGAPGNVTVAQTISGSGTFRNSVTPTANFTGMLIRNTSGANPAVTMSIGNVSFSGTLTLTSGIVDVGAANDIMFTTSAAIVGSAAGWVIRNGSGFMKKDIAAGASSFAFFVGDNTGTAEYSPITLNFSANSVARTIGVRLVDGNHPQINNPSSAVDYLSRYWSFYENAAGGTYAYTAAMTYIVASDVVGTESNLTASYFNGSNWILATGSIASPVLTSGTLTDASIALNGLELTGRAYVPTNFTWVGGTSNDYNNGLNWNLGTVPGSADNITIPAAANPCTILSGAVTVAGFTISGTGDFRMLAATSFTVTSNTFSYTSSVAPSLDCSSTINFSNINPITIPAWNYGNLNLTGGNRTLPNTGTVGICGTFTRGAGVYSIGTSTVDYNGAGVQTISTGTYYNLTISNARTTNNITLGSGIIDINNVFSPTATFTSGVVVVSGNSINFSGGNGQGIPAFFYGSITNANFARTWASSGIIDINAGFSPPTSAINTITGSTIRYSSTATGWGLTTFTTNIAGRQYNNLIFNGVGGGWGFLTNLTIGVAGDFTMANGTLTISTTSVTGVLNIDGNMNVSGGTVRVAGNAASSIGTININNGNFNLSGGTVDLIYASGSATGNIYLLGSGAAYNQTGGTLTRSFLGFANSFTFKGTSGSPQTISQTGGTITSLVQITLDPLQLRTNLVSNFNLGASAGAGFNLNGGIFDASTYVVSGSGGYGSNANTTFITAHAGGFNGSMAVTGSKSLSFDANYVYNSTSVAQVTGASVVNAKGITINNTSGINPAVTLSASISLNPFTPPGNLTLSNGVLRLDAFNITLASTATTTGGSSTSFVQTNSTGALIKTVTNGQSLSGINFPVGETTNYTPFAFTAGTAGAAGTVSVRVIAGAHPNMSPATNYINRYWDIAYSAAIITTGVGITAKYLAGDIVTGPESSMRASVWTASLSTWVEDAATTPGTPTALTITESVPNTTMFTTGAALQLTARAEAPLYYRSRQTGNWPVTTTWESSPNISFIPLTSPATYCPTASNSLGIIIQNAHIVSTTTNATLDQTTIQNGGVLAWTAATLTVNNGTGDDMTINSGGIFRHAFSSPLPTLVAGALIRVNTGGIIDVTVGTNVEADGYASDQYTGAPRNMNVVWETGSIFNWNNTSPFTATGRTYFPNAAAAEIPIFRISQNIGTNIGGASSTTINGVLEANATSNWANAGLKIFRNGIRGTSTTTQLNACGQFQFTGTSAELNGAGTLVLNNNGLSVQSGCTTSMATAGRIVTTAGGGIFGISSGGILNIDANLTAMNGAMQVNSGGTINCKGNTVGGGGTFTNLANGTLITALSTGVNGAIVVAGTKTFTAGSNYTFTGTANQVTGTSMPTTVGILSISNVGINPTDIVTMSNLATTATTLNLTSGRFYAGTGGTLDIANGGSVVGTGGNQQLTGAAADNIIRFAGVNGGTITGTPELWNVTIGGNTSGGLNFANNARINNNFLINNNGAVVSNSPKYAAGSTLIYNSTGAYTRNLEWGSNVALAPSYPHHVIIQNGTTVNFTGTTTFDVGCGGNLSIGNPTVAGAGTLSLTNFLNPNDLFITGHLLVGGAVAGGTLVMSDNIGSDIYLTGNWTRNANGTVNFGAGNGRAVFFEGATDATITANGGQQFPYVYINKSTPAKKVTLADHVSISDEIGFNQGTTDLGTNNKFLSILSTATKTGRVGPSSAANTAFVYGATDLLGQFIIQRYVPARRSWRLVAAPLKPGGGTHTVSEAWQERTTGLDYTTAAATTASIGTDTITAAFGTQITGGTTANGFDQSPNSNTSIRYYNSGAWFAPANINGTSVNNYEGWMVFFRGDRKNYGQITNQYKTPTITTLRPRGQVFIGTKSITASGMTVVGNPYASAVDYNSMSRTGAGWPANPTYYVWDPYLGGATGQGAFVTLTWNGTNFTRSSPYGAGTYDNRYIPSGAAIMVDFPAGGGTLTFNETDKNAASTTTAFRPVRQRQLMTVLNTVNADSSTYVSDAVLSLFSENFNNNTDVDDAIKMTNYAENFALTRNGKILSIERRRPVANGDTIFYDISRMQRKNYQMEFIMDNISTSPSVTAFLEDKCLNVKTPVSMQDTSRVDFVISSDANAAADRFRLVFRRSVKYTSIDALVVNKDIVVEWKAADEFNISSYEVERSSDGTNFTGIGSRLSNGDTNDPVQYNWLDISPAPGKYFYRIKSISKNGVVDYSDIVKVKIVKGSPELYVFPNPVTDAIIRLQMNNALAGLYSSILLGSNGQVINTEQFVHAGGTATKIIKPSQDLTAGTYQLKLTGPDNKLSVIKVIVVKN